MKIDKIELTSDQGNIHLTVENPDGLREMDVDLGEEIKNLAEHMEQNEHVERSPYIEELACINEDLVYLGDKPEQYQDAIVGITYDNNHVIYDVDKFIELLMKEGMTYEEAEDWTGCNISRAIPYMGECAPILMYSREG